MKKKNERWRLNGEQISILESMLFTVHYFHVLFLSMCVCACTCSSFKMIAIETWNIYTNTKPNEGHQQKNKERKKKVETIPTTLNDC